MAESPRTAQNVEYIMKDADDICYYLKALFERADYTEAKKVQAEMIVAIYRLTVSIECLQSTCRSIHQELTGNSAHKEIKHAFPQSGNTAQDSKVSIPGQRTLLH